MSKCDLEYPSDWTPLHIAVWRHDYAKTSTLADPGSVNAADDLGWTPVHLACAGERSMLFLQQTTGRDKSFSNRGLSRGPYRERYYDSEDDNERASAMGILEILLKFKPNLKQARSLNLSLSKDRSHRFPTALHCAASSGWLSHARALVEAGAPVYTGPGCSPLCWVADKKLAVASFLRELLGDHGLAMIEQDHTESNRSGHPSNSRPLPRPEARAEIDLNGLCHTCSQMPLIKMLGPVGYIHLRLLDLVRQSANQCKFCKIIREVLGQERHLDQNEHNQVIVRASNGKKRHRGVCMEPPVLRSFDFRFSAGCTCKRQPYEDTGGVLDFSKCRGTCDAIEASVNIFVKTKSTHTLPIERIPGNVDTRDYTFSIQQGIDIDADPLSLNSTHVMLQWLKKCSTSHPLCRQNRALRESGSLPSSTLFLRLIDVKSSDGASIRVYDTVEQYSTYIALSHRWVSGPMPQWVTRRDNFEERHGWFSLANLPASIVDAVRITRNLGMQYLWIDSLCIIQDSLEDWETQSSQMASIYNNAHLTLFASCGLDDAHGFLHCRETSAATPVRLSTGNFDRIEIYFRKKSLSTSFSSAQRSVFFTNVDDSYLAERGWIMQERFLSRRIIHFGKDQMFWECNEGTFAEDGHVVSRRGQRECGQTEDPFSKLAYSNMLDDPSPLPESSFHSQWEHLVKAYSPLKLTNAEDKLPALSGLAVTFHSRWADNEYIAGMWKQGLQRYLPWSITNRKPKEAHRVFRAREYSDGSSGGHLETDASFVHPSQLHPRPATYRAPSFSWACVDGEIVFHNSLEFTADIESVTVSPQAAHNPHGRLESACLIISGPLRQAWSCGPLQSDIGSVFNPAKAGYVPLYDTGWPFGFMLPDSKGDVDEKGDLYCLKLGDKKYSRDNVVNCHVFLVLVAILQRDENSSISKFRRVGLGFTIYKSLEFFDGAEIKTIEII